MILFFLYRWNKNYFERKILLFSTYMDKKGDFTHRFKDELCFHFI